MAGASRSRPGASRDDGAEPGARRRRTRAWVLAGPSLVAACMAAPGAAAPIAAARPVADAAAPDRGRATEPGAGLVADRVGVDRSASGAADRPTDVVDLHPAVLRAPAIRGPVTRLAFLGDSLIADLRLLSPDADRNDVVARVEAALEEQVGAVDVENLGRPGQSLVFVREDFRRHDRRITTLRPALQTFFAERPLEERPHLAVIATTGIDVNVMAGLPIEVLAPILVDALTKAVDDLAELGIQAVLLPIFPVSDALHDRHAGTVLGAEARVAEVNARLARSGLPVLFDRFDGLDVDGRPGSDAGFYARGSTDHPDDGVHPGPEGRQVYVDNVVDALVPLLRAANAPEPPPIPPEVTRA